MTALSHLKVIDLSRILAGPWASQILADMGAKVIKIERPGEGDDTRHWGPPFLNDRDGKPTAEAAYYLSTNRNKQSVTIDITCPEGQELVRELVRGADILLENFKVGGLAKYGLDYASLVSINPRLVYCSITGFGQTGPYAPRPGYDVLLQAMGGFMSVTGRREGEPGAGPQKVGVAVVDLLTGLYAATGILGAIASREQSGKGQHIDLALLDVEVACLANQGMNYLVSGVSPKPMGNAHPNIVPYQDFPTADGAMIVAVGNDGQFARLMAEIGQPGLGVDPAYATNGARVANRDALLAIIREATVQRTTGEWVEALERANVPCGPVNSIAEVFADPQVVSREMARTIEHPLAGPIPIVASPLRFSGTPVEYRNAPPLLGQNTDEVLRDELGLTAERIAELAAKGVI